ncbi:MAG: trehalose-phosphatase [Candidatus Bipolaricaulia bacterium]
MRLISPLNQEFLDNLARNISGSGGLLLCTDFDGTLVNFTGSPSETSLPGEIKELLTKLATLERLHLAVISGRSFHELEELVPLKNTTLAGNHGLKIRFEDGTHHELEPSEEMHRVVAALKDDLQKTVGGKEGIIIEDKSFGLAIHYRKYDGDKEEIKKQFYRIWEEHSMPDLEVIKGAELLEVRPSNWNKGDAVRLLQERCGEMPTIYLGDDTTDEDAFRILRDQNSGIPIIVNKDEEVETEAQYRLQDPEEVSDFLAKIDEIFASN